MTTFSEFYQLYPRHVGRRAAEMEWVKAIRRGEDPSIIIDGLRRNLAYLESRPMEFRPHPRTWLSQGRWEDEQQVIAAPDRKRSIADAARDIITNSAAGGNNNDDHWLQRFSTIQH